MNSMDKYLMIMENDVDYKQLKKEEMKTPEQKYTKNELEYNEIHKELMELKLYELATKLSSTFYSFGTERYNEGIEMVKEVWDLKKYDENN